MIEEILTVLTGAMFVIAICSIVWFFINDGWK